MFLYNLAIRIYSFLISFAALFNTKAQLFVSGRKHTFQQLQAFSASVKQPVIWFHCASLGEFEQGRPLIEKIKKEYPHYSILLSFFSPSGYEIQKEYAFADHVCYLPVDSPSNAKKFIAISQPVLAIFIKYEFWLNYLHQLHQQGIPTLLVAGIFRPDQHFFKSYGSIFRTSLKNYKHLFLQNNESLQLVKSLGIKKCSVSGDTRFDRVYELAQHPKMLPEIQKFTGNRITIIAGSTWPRDGEVLLNTFRRLKSIYKNTCLVVAPHNVDKSTIKHLEGLLREHKSTYNLFSDPSQNYAVADVLIIDSIGILSAVYQYGHIAYIGGGFDSGIHNILEALTYGLPVVFGPNHTKYDEALAAIKIGAGFSFQDENQLKEIFMTLINNPVHLKEAKQKSLEYVANNTGSAEKITDYLVAEKLLKKQC